MSSRTTTSTIELTNENSHSRILRVRKIIERYVSRSHCVDHFGKSLFFFYLRAPSFFVPLFSLGPVAFRSLAISYPTVFACSSLMCFAIFVFQLRAYCRRTRVCVCLCLCLYLLLFVATFCFDRASACRRCFDVSALLPNFEPNSIYSTVRYFRSQLRARARTPIEL